MKSATRRSRLKSHISLLRRELVICLSSLNYVGTPAESFVQNHPTSLSFFVYLIGRYEHGKKSMGSSHEWAFIVGFVFAKVNFRNEFFCDV